MQLSIFLSNSIEIQEAPVQRSIFQKFHLGNTFKAHRTRRPDVFVTEAKCSLSWKEENGKVTNTMMVRNWQNPLERVEKTFPVQHAWSLLIILTAHEASKNPGYDIYERNKER